MQVFNTQEIFKFNRTLFFPTLNIEKIKPLKITIPKLRTFEYYRVDKYYIDLYSKVPHHSHR